MLTVLIFILDGIGFLNLPKSAIQVITIPIQYSVYSAKHGIDETFSFLTFWKSGEARIKNLEQRNLELAAAADRAKILEKENGELRKQLGARAARPKELFPAAVLGAGRFLSIGVGVHDGVKVGQTVVYLNNLVGKIVATSPRSSLVQLPTDPDARTPVKVKQARGLVIGQYNSSMILDRVAQNEEIGEGDMVLTSGEGNSLEADLNVGKIEKIESSGSDLFQRGALSPVLDFGHLGMVFVILN